MTFRMCVVFWACAITSVVAASQDSIGPNGIKSAGLLGADGQPLTGAGVGIGQVDIQRPGDADVGDSLSHRNTTINPQAVYERDSVPPPPAAPQADSNPINIEGSHAEWVAGVMISNHATATGVAQSALLYAAGYRPTGDDETRDAEVASMAQLIATRTTPTGGQVHAINFSIAVPTLDLLDGNQLLTQFVDWSAAKHDVLYVQGGRNMGTAPNTSVPMDNYNGITVARSSKIGGVYRQVSAGNDFSEPIEGSTEGPRTAIGLIAPGDNIEMTGLGNTTASDAANDGTSFAAPHVTGTVALLQQYAGQRNGQARWNEDQSRRHEVMKAVLLNSADKIVDDGTYTIPGHAQTAPVGTFLGMERTIVDQQNNDWFESEAYGDDPFSDGSTKPLDDQMGAGHLNAKRALQQYSPGEYESDSTPVPVIGWDFGHTSGDGDYNKYAIAQPLLGGSFISISMAWDRVVTFEDDANSNGQYDPGDTFEEHFDPFLIGDDVINDLDVFLVPSGQSVNDAVAQGYSNDSTIEHVFFEIPMTGSYEIWVNQWDDEANNAGQDYGIAWWAKSSVNPAASGDYSGNGTVGPEDYTAWKTNFGTTNPAADGNGDGKVDAADYTVWRDHLGQGPGSGSLANVPEPSGLWLTFVGLICVVGSRRLDSALSRPEQSAGE